MSSGCLLTMNSAYSRKQQIGQYFSFHFFFFLFSIIIKQFNTKIMNIQKIKKRKTTIQPCDHTTIRPYDHTNTTIRGNKSFHSCEKIIFLPRNSVTRYEVQQHQYSYVTLSCLFLQIRTDLYKCNAGVTKRFSKRSS